MLVTSHRTTEKSIKDNLLYALYSCSQTLSQQSYFECNSPDRKEITLKLKRYSNNTVTVNSLGHDNHVARYSDSPKYDTRAQKTNKKND